MINYRISPTTGLNLYKECPKCFWLHYNSKVSRPRGIFPSLPGGMDEVIKVYFDKYRGKKPGLPPEIVGKVSGILVPDQALMDSWRNWRTGLSWETEISFRQKKAQVTLFGALDDCLIDGQNYIPLDYKTRGSAPRPGDSEQYYQTQLDSYATLLNHNGLPVADFGFLVYYYPDKVAEKGSVTFHVQPVKVGTSVARLEKLLTDAVKLLLSPMPKEHSRCEYADWHNLIREFD